MLSNADPSPFQAACNVVQSPTWAMPYVCDVRLDPMSENGFYADFSDSIENGGVFISTYDTKPVHTPMSVRIRFPDGDRVTVDGRVEWVREYNPLTPETVPGMGVKIQSLNQFQIGKIQAYIKNNPPMLFDNRAEPEACGTVREPEAVSTPDWMCSIGELLAAAFPTLAPDPAPLPEDCEDRAFFEGLARDALALAKTQYPEEAPSTPVPAPPQASPGPLSDQQAPAVSVQPLQTKERLSRPALRVDVIPSQSSDRQFQGGFSSEDMGARVFVSTPSPHPIGTHLALSIRSQSGHRASGTGTVRWVRRYNPMVSTVTAPPGMGILLSEISDYAWQGLIAELPQENSEANTCLMCVPSE